MGYGRVRVCVCVVPIRPGRSQGAFALRAPPLPPQECANAMAAKSSVRELSYMVRARSPAAAAPAVRPCLRAALTP
jgi:hypothetical protein